VIVVADTSPLNYLIQIECDSLLPRIYGRIIIPKGVMKELAHASAPDPVRDWLTNLPSWVDVDAAQSLPDGSLAFLGPGEREAIQLAQEQRADLLLMDERKGRLEARRRGLRTTGTLGVLVTAGELRMVNAEAKYRQLLVATTFRTSEDLEAQFLRQIAGT
jgi:predicted nucleic acid-binding protein